MFFPKSIGLSLHENDLIISRVSQKLAKCTSENIVIKDFLIKDSLETKLIIDAEGYQAREIVLSWPREKTIAREIELPYSSIKELKESILYQLDSFVLYSEDEIYYDIYPSKTSEHGEKAFIFAVKREDLDDLLSKLELLNISPSRVVISPLSFVPLVNHSKLATICKCRDFYVFNFYMESVLVNTSLIRNEELLREKIVEYKPDKVVLLNKEDDYLVDFCKDDIEVELWEKTKESLGAAINGVSEYIRDFNVLKVKRNKFTHQLILAGVLSLLIFAFAFVMPYIIKYKRELAIKAIDSRLQELRPDVDKINRLENEIDNIFKETRKLNEIVNLDNRRIDLFAELTRVLPDDTWVKQLSIKRGYFEMEGIGLSGANVLALLENSPFFSQVRFTSSVIKDRKGKEKFKIKGNTK
ncbi:MAG: PilN domain-containing protein [Candidatus Scalinduaceae bacterium]